MVVRAPQQGQRSRLEGKPGFTPNRRGEILVSALPIDDIAIYTIEQARDIDGRQIPVKEFADLVGLDRSALYDILSGRRHVWAAEVPRFVRAAHSFALADAIEQQIGRVGVQLPDEHAATTEVMRRVSQCVQEFGELLHEIGLATGDGVITREEAQQVRVEGEQVIAAVHAILQQVEQQGRKGGAR
jgi:hypothetical protein